MHARLTPSSRPGHHTFCFSTLCSILGRSRFTLLTIQPPAILCLPVYRTTISHRTSSIGSQTPVSVQSILRRTSFKPWQSLVILPTVKTKQHKSSCISKDHHVRALRHAFMGMEQYGSTRADEEMADKQKVPNGGMKENSGHDDVCHLDRTQFERGYTVKALKLPKQCCSKYMKLLRGIVLAKPKVKAVITDPQELEKRLILLDESVQSLSDERISDKVRQALLEDGCEESEYKMKEEYANLSTEAVLKELLPKGCEIPGSFETVGHIAHLNIKDELLPYKHIIGQVILDKNKSIKTVVNKVGILENEYRVLPLEVIAGENRLEATVNQHKARFKLNYAEVYWNSRLEEEHNRLTKTFKAGEIVADVMAGIGPFAIHAAQRGCQVFANDLNPRSYHYLKENIKLNKVLGVVQASQLDGREFIRALGGAQAALNSEELEERGPKEAESCQNDATGLHEENLPLRPTYYHHAIMNLPATALEFLDAFRGSFLRGLWEGKTLPLVHVYTFARSAETESDIRERAEMHLGGSLEDAEVKIRLVRDVAPNKRMMCLSFRVPKHIAFNTKEELCCEQNSKITSGPQKRVKLTGAWEGS